jgi:hypothetical protein
MFGVVGSFCHRSDLPSAVVRVLVAVVAIVIRGCDVVDPTVVANKYYVPKNVVSNENEMKLYNKTYQEPKTSQTTLFWALRWLRHPS